MLGRAAMVYRHRNFTKSPHDAAAVNDGCERTAQRRFPRSVTLAIATSNRERSVDAGPPSPFSRENPA
jgi:hypothetical protein